MRPTIALILALFFLGLQPGLARKMDSSLDLIDAVNANFDSKNTADDITRFKALYSKESSLCARAYFDGDTKRGEASWSKLLGSVKDMKSVRPVIKTLHGQVVMCGGDDAEPKCFGLCLYSSIARSTERTLGAKHRFYADALGFMGDYYEDIKDFKTAIKIRTEELSIRTLSNGRLDKLTGDAAYSLALDCLSAKDYKNALRYDEQAIAAYTASQIPLKLKNALNLRKSLTSREAK